MNQTDQIRPSLQPIQGASEHRCQWRQWLRLIKIVASYHDIFPILYHGSILYRIFRLRGCNPVTTAFMERRGQEASARGAIVKRIQIWKPYDQISADLIKAVVIGEDPHFHLHSGLDWKGIRIAFVTNLRARRIARGGSTITQQLAKNLFLSSSKTILRKLHECLIALETDLILNKRRILELYLNVIEWGEGVYGVEAAANHYFNLPAASLTQEQSAFLVAMIPGPLDAYNPDLHPNRVRHRRDVILASMKEDPLPERDLRQLASKTVMPVFPDEARKVAATGVVIARVRLDAKGNVTKVEVLASPHRAIVTPVIEALRQWRFQPSNVDGQRLPTTGKLSFYYSIENGKGVVRNPLIRQRARYGLDSALWGRIGHFFARLSQRHGARRRGAGAMSKDD